jgi:hypothetical protein
MDGLELPNIDPGVVAVFFCLGAFAICDLYNCIANRQVRQNYNRVEHIAINITPIMETHPNDRDDVKEPLLSPK